jgi:hypothetical protein
LSNQDEVKKLSDQVVAEVLLELFKEKQTQQQRSYDEFIAASYGEKALSVKVIKSKVEEQESNFVSCFKDFTQRQNNSYI